MLIVVFLMGMVMGILGLLFIIKKCELRKGVQVIKPPVNLSNYVENEG